MIGCYGVGASTQCGFATVWFLSCSSIDWGCRCKLCCGQSVLNCLCGPSERQSHTLFKKFRQRYMIARFGLNFISFMEHSYLGMQWQGLQNIQCFSIRS